MYFATSPAKQGCGVIYMAESRSVYGRVTKQRLARKIWLTREQVNQATLDQRSGTMKQNCELHDSKAILTENG
jgi:hypothetical protein